MNDDMTNEDVDAELDRLGIYMPPAIERVHKALRAARDRDLVVGAMPFVEFAAKHADNPTLRAEAEVWLSRLRYYER